MSLHRMANGWLFRNVNILEKNSSPSRFWDRPTRKWTLFDDVNAFTRQTGVL